MNADSFVMPVLSFYQTAQISLFKIGITHFIMIMTLYWKETTKYIKNIINNQGRRTGVYVLVSR